MDHFSLQQKRRGAAYQAVFSVFGETKSWGTSSSIRPEAEKRARKVQNEILNELALMAALKGKPTPGYTTKPAREELKPDEPSSWEPPPLDCSKPAPQGSFRQQIEIEVKFVLENKDSPTRKREATDSQKHLYEVYGGYVDLPVGKFDGPMGDHLAAFYNDPVRFFRCSENYATIMRRFLRPIVERKILSREFFTALEKVKRQSDGTDASDPLMADHFRKIDQRLKTGHEEDYLTGLHLIGCHPAPQMRDAVLLRWEGVDFGTGLIKLFRGKTDVIAIFKMSKPLRAWLWRRRQAAPKDAMYVFWELAWLKADRDKPDFNQTLDPEKRANSISSYVGTVWREFLHRATVPVGLVKSVEGDIIDLKGFAGKLRTKAEPKYEWFFNRCKNNCKKALQQEPKTEEEFKKLEKLLRTNLNEIIEGEFAYDEKIIAKEALRGQTRELLNPDYEGARLHQFHRLFLEDLFPELRRIEFTNYKYSYSSYRKSLVSFLRSLHFRDPVIAKILGQDALESQNAYDRVAEHELQRGCDLTEGHIEAMIEGRPEFYPSIPQDLFEKTMEQFGVQKDVCEKLAVEFRRLLAEAEEQAQERHKEVMAAVKGEGRQTRGMLAVETVVTQERLAAIEARLAALEEIGRRLIETIPPNMPTGSRSHLIVCIRLMVWLILWLASGNGRPSTRQLRSVPQVLQLGPAANSEETES